MKNFLTPRSILGYLCLAAAAVTAYIPAVPHAVSLALGSAGAGLLHSADKPTLPVFLFVLAGVLAGGVGCANPVDTTTLQNDLANCGAVPSEPGWYIADEPCGYLGGLQFPQRATQGLTATVDTSSFERASCAYHTVEWVDPYFGTFSSGPGFGQGLYIKGFTGDPPGPEAYMRLDAPNGDVCLVTVRMEPATGPNPWLPPGS